MELKLEGKYFHISLDNLDVHDLQENNTVSSTAAETPISRDVVISTFPTPDYDTSDNSSRLDNIISMVTTPARARIDSALYIDIPQNLVHYPIMNAVGIVREEIAVSHSGESQGGSETFPEGGVIVEFPYPQPLFDTLTLFQERESAAS